MSLFITLEFEEGEAPSDQEAGRLDEWIVSLFQNASYSNAPDCLHGSIPMLSTIEES